MFTSEHYTAIATALRGRPNNTTASSVINSLCHLFAEDNPHFSYIKFTKSLGDLTPEESPPMKVDYTQLEAFAAPHMVLAVRRYI